MSGEDPISVLNKRVRLYQPENGFRTSLDSVMVAAACPIQSQQSLLDIGCGVGSIGLCVLKRVPDVSLTGVDIQEDHIALCEKNALENRLSGQVNFVCDDIRRYREGGFDHVICNPPYEDVGTYLVSPSQSKALAKGHIEVSRKLDDWIEAGFHNLKNGGTFTIIHKADFLQRIMLLLGKRFGAVEIIPLWPRAGVASKRVIVRAIRNRKSPAKLHPGLVLHEEDGEYTSEANKILREMEPLY